MSAAAVRRAQTTLIKGFDDKVSIDAHYLDGLICCWVKLWGGNNGQETNSKGGV
ncbi:hypothetical protein OROHE_011020 [Orobanche hederae]